MDGRVLGVVSVGPSGPADGPTVMGTTKPAALFALLLTSPNGRCPVPDVFDCLWPGQVFARSRLDQAMRVLRKALGNALFLRTECGVCVIDPPRDQIDLYRFRDLLASAERLLGKDRFNTISAAMAQWPQETGPLSGLTQEWAVARRAELRQEWLAALRAQFEAAQRAGLNEWLRAETDRFYRELTDQPWLFTYYLRQHGSSLSPTRLEKEIKRWIDNFKRPSEDLQEIIGQLRGNRATPHTVLRYVPRQLPPQGRPALGRRGVIREVVETVLRQQECGRPSTVVIGGMPGIGKRLVVNLAAHQLQHSFPDGTLYADLGGIAGRGEQPADPEYVIDRFLAEFPLPTSPVGLAQKSAALRSVLANRSVLIVLDQVWDDQQVLPLLPGTGASAVLIASSRRLEALRAGQRVTEWTLGELDHEAATALLHEYIPLADRRKASEEIKELVKFCDGHPLALTVAVQRLDGQAYAAIQNLHHQLRKEEERLDALDNPRSQLSVQAVLACSVDALSEEARCLLWQLAVHPGPSIGWAALLDLGMAAGGLHTDRALEELRAAHLVELLSGRYRVNELVRTFARLRVQPVALAPGAGFEEATVRQILEHQLQNAWACDRWLDEQRWLPVGEPQQITVVQPEGVDHALALIEEEYDTLVRGIELSIARGLSRYTWLLPMALVTYQWRRHRFEDAQRFLARAAEAAQQSGAPPVDQAMICRMRAGTSWHQGHFNLAANQFLGAVRLSGHDPSQVGKLSLARSLHALALARRKQGRESEAERCERSALEVYRELADEAGTAAVLNGLGTLHHDRGEHEEALRLCTEALALVHGTADRSGGADVLRTLAGIRFALGEQEPAFLLFQQAIEIYRDLGSWIGEDRALWLYADTLVAAGQPVDAVVVLERVLVLREQMGGAGLTEVRDRLESLR
ncbi:tetratricopeptide repeat protein [Streptomyces sp. NPDC004031]